ncbi:hypothetical protein C8R46DRAFT_981437, partial [Mycena filopes]
MAEILGTISAIVQLVETTLKVREYIHDFRHAPQEHQNLLAEMDALRPLLGELQSRIAANPSSSVIVHMDNPLQAFKSTMEDFTKSLQLEDGPLSKFSKQLKWAMRSKKEAKEYLEKTEQFKSLLNSWLLIDLWDMGQRGLIHNEVMLQNVAGVQEEILSSVGIAASGYRQHIDLAERKQIIDWFSPLNFFLQQADISGARQEGTGKWLLAEPQFREWEIGVSKTLWCRGIPGAGKTVLSSMVVDHLNTKFQAKDIGVASIYINHKETDIQTPSNLLSGLWRQLIFGRQISPEVRKLHKHHLEKATRPSLNEILGILRAEISHFSKVYIVVDAVDEYPEGTRHILLDHLMTIGWMVNLMITSRPHINPHPTLPNIQIMEVRANDVDIQTYVVAQIKSSPRLSKHILARPNLRDEIISKISSTADGMFLLAKLHVGSLSTKNTIKAVREALENLPKDLHDTYNNALKRIQDQNDEDRMVAHSALTWVANACRPLTTAEIQVALAIEPNSQQLDDDNILDIEIIVAACAGLIIVDEQLAIVRLVHYTAQEYFDSIQGQYFPHAQILITRSLLTFLNFDNIITLSCTTQDSPPPLFDYAQYCLVHAAGEPEVQLRNMVVDFLGRVKNIKHEEWLSPPWDLLYWPEQCSPLWVAAATNLVETAGFLLFQYPQEEITEALQIASLYGHLQIVELLVANGASIDAPGGLYESPMSEFVGDFSPDSYGRGTNFGNALQAATIGQSVDVVQFLLDKRANVNTNLGHYGNPLQAACIIGNEIIVGMLLENGADVNAWGGQFGTALQAAACREQEIIVRLLLESGADTNLLGGKYGTALQAACVSGSETIVELLLENGAYADAQAGEYDTALRAACIHGYDNIVQLLCKYGASVNLEDENGNSLQAALFQGDEDIVRLLVENGANVKMPCGPYKDALEAALSLGQESIAAFILQTMEGNSNTNAQYALEAALYQGNDVAVQSLINDMEMMYGQLEVALSTGDDAFAQVLIEQLQDASM